MGSFIFLSRWLQAPLYLGLIVAQAVYVYRFLLELWHLIGFVLLGHAAPSSVHAHGNHAKSVVLTNAPEAVVATNAPASGLTAPETTAMASDPETVVMLSVLGLIDVVMIANLLIMVIVGGYETFVSRLRLEGHPDQPEWLSHVNAGILKVKLATALIGISSIHLLKTFISAHHNDTKMMYWQVVIHVTFVASAIALAWIDRLTFRAVEKPAPARPHAVA